MPQEGLSMISKLSQDSFMKYKVKTSEQSTGFVFFIYLASQKISHHVHIVQKLQCELESKHHIINSHFKTNTLINRRHITSAEAR